jgi:non-heme chloroperoxidase
MSLSRRERSEVEAANASKRPTVVFVHGLWLLAGSWDGWRRMFEDSGYATVSTDWPGDAETVDEGRADPQTFAKRSIAQIIDHQVEVLQALESRPAVVGHSFGGLFTQILAGRGLASVSVAIDPGPSRGVLPLPFSALRVASVALRNPANRGRAVGLTAEQFRYGFANVVSEEESRELYETYAVPGSAMPLFSAAFANLNPRTPAKVNFTTPQRGPMLVVSGEQDHTVPHAIAYAAYKLQRRNKDADTEFTEFPDRGHSLVIDSGWREVAEVALAFVAKHYPARRQASSL